jgi:lipoprotein
MKKFLAVLLAAVTVACMFVACSKADDKNTTQSTTASVENATDKAKIKDSDAINFIKTSYTKNELGLDKVKEKYDFMISQNGVKIGKKQYVKVAANIMKKNDTTSKDGKQTYSLTPVGEYYISFDGDEVLMKDLKSGKYKKLENRYQDYSAKGQTAQSTTK